MKRFLVVLSALALLAGTTPALAGGYGHRHGGHGGYYKFKHGGYYGHGYRKHRSYGHRGYGYRRHHDHGYGYAVVGALAGGVILGHLLTRPAYPSVVYAAPPPAYRNCQPTTGTGYVNGRLAEFSGTWCVDAYGRATVIPGSERFLRYLY